MIEILDKIAIVRSTLDGIGTLPPAFGPRLAKITKKGLLYTSQAFQQVGSDRRHAVMIALLREIEAMLTDGVLSMFQSLVARANLRARKRLEETITSLPSRAAPDWRASPMYWKHSSSRRETEATSLPL